MNETFYHNTISLWLQTGIVIAISLTLIRLISFFILKKLSKLAQRSANKWDDYIVDAINSFVLPVLYIVSVYLPLQALSFPVTVENILKGAFVSCITYFVIRLITTILKRAIYAYVDAGDESIGKRNQAKGLVAIFTIGIWIGGLIFLIDNFGYNVTTLIAGMGIGGIAVALAAQNILGDLFSYFSIFFDRPFEIGDFVAMDDKAGIVEYIGIKTTRLRTLEGDQLIVANADITGSRLHNYKRLERRRVLFSIGIIYGTSFEKLKSIPNLVKQIIENKDQTTYDRGHLKSYGDFSINFEFVYFISTPEYIAFMDIQESIYMDIYQVFEQHGIEFAFPTQTIYLQQAEGRDLIETLK